MAEKNTEGVENPRRRLFLKRGIAATAVLLGGSLAVRHEVKKGDEGIQTNSGVFIPLYENHDVGINPNDIPKDLDVFFRGIPINEFFYKADPKEAIQAERFRPIAAPYFHFPEKILTTLAKNKTLLMLGDLSVYLPEDLLLQAGEITASVLLGSVLLAIESGGLGARISRMKFLKGAIAGAAAWSLSNPVSALPQLLPVNEFQENAILRILTRIHGLQSHLHPEQLVNFFRNVIMALRMTTVADQLKQGEGRKIKIGFNVGTAHSGIEDLLLAGPDFCRRIVLAYPTKILKEAVKNVGGIENFCSAILFELPPELTIEDTESSKNLAQVIKRKVTDQKLAHLLEQKLAT